MPIEEVNLGGIVEKRRLRIEVGIIMGDQLSQDCACGRKSSNKGGAGRVHRACMCSAVYASDASFDSCSKLVNVDVVNALNDLALKPKDNICQTIENILPGVSGRDKRENKAAKDFVKRKVSLATALLGNPYTLHPLRSAFEGLSFGANKHGVFVASADDHLHSNEAGLLLNANHVAYHSMTKTEATVFEDAIRRVTCGTKPQ